MDSAAFGPKGSEAKISWEVDSPLRPNSRVSRDYNPDIMFHGEKNDCCKRHRHCWQHITATMEFITTELLHKVLVHRQIWDQLKCSGMRQYVRIECNGVQHSELLGFWTLPMVWNSNTRKHNVSETAQFLSSYDGRKTLILLGPFERAYLNHWSNARSALSKGPNRVRCFHPSS
jgi:hypothetical protein